MQKRFDMPEKVSCNECEHYYDSNCNGHNTTCNSFKVARVGKIDKILNQIKWCVYAVLIGYAINLILQIWRML